MTSKEISPTGNTQYSQFTQTKQSKMTLHDQLKNITILPDEEHRWVMDETIFNQDFYGTKSFVQLNGHYISRITLKAGYLIYSGFNHGEYEKKHCIKIPCKTLDDLLTFFDNNGIKYEYKEESQEMSIESIIEEFHKMYINFDYIHSHYKTIVDWLTKTLKEYGEQEEAYWKKRCELAEGVISNHIDDYDHDLWEKFIEQNPKPFDFNQDRYND